MRILKGLLLTTGIFLTALSANAQCKDWIWPEDRKAAEEKNVLYSDAVKAKQFREAVGPWQWLMTNTPNLNSSIYINGTKIYYALAQAEKDPVKKAELVDSLLWIHDIRIEVCGQEEKVFPRKAFYNYIFNIRNTKDEANITQLYDMYERVFEMLGKDVDQGNAQAYLNVLKVYQLRLKKLSDDEVLAKYDRLMGVIDNGLSKTTDKKKIDKWEATRTKADEMLAGLINIECDFVKSNFGPKLEANPNDLKVAEWIFKFMLIGKCTDDPLWLEAGKVVNQHKPDFGIAKNIGIKSKANGNKAQAEKYFKQALNLAKADSDKADMYVQLGHLKAEAGAKSAARELFRKSLGANSSSADPYSYIGNLYFRSFEDCAGKEDKAKDRLIFIAAYNMFKRSGNAKLMNAAKAQFPSKEEIFEQNYNAGDAMTVGCWINESVILDTRD